MASASPLQVKIKVDAHKASTEFKVARRDLNARMREGLKMAGERTALPAARTVAWSPFAPTLVVRATRSSAYITTRLRGTRGRALGLLEFGGRVKTVILPKKKLALTVGPDVVRANVETPRRYRQTLRMTHAVQSRQPQIQQDVRSHVLLAFSGFEIV